MHILSNSLQRGPKQGKTKVVSFMRGEGIMP
jgi:hypothetical protein